MPKRKSTNCCCSCESGVVAAVFWAIDVDDKCAKAKIRRQMVNFLFIAQSYKIYENGL